MCSCGLDVGLNPSPGQNIRFPFSRNKASTQSALSSGRDGWIDAGIGGWKGVGQIMMDSWEAGQSHV